MTVIVAHKPHVFLLISEFSISTQHLFQYIYIYISLTPLLPTAEEENE